MIRHNRISSWLLGPPFWLLASGCWLLTCAAYAAPSKEDVFKSISDNVGDAVDPTKFFAMLIGIAGICLVLAVLGRRRQKEVVPKTLNHQGRLLKETSKELGLKTAEMKQLKALALDEKVENPLTLLLCPSVLARAAKAHPDKVDRHVLSQIAKRLSTHDDHRRAVS